MFGGGTNHGDTVTSGNITAGITAISAVLYKVTTNCVGTSIRKTSVRALVNVRGAVRGYGPGLGFSTCREFRSVFHLTLCVRDIGPSCGVFLHRRPCVPT